DRLAAAGFVDVLEELVAGKIPAALHDAGQPAIAEGHRMAFAALAAELEFDIRPVQLHVAVAHGGEAEGAVLPSVLLVAHANQGRLEQLHHGRQDLVPRQPGQREIPGTTLPDSAE